MWFEEWFDSTYYHSLYNNRNDVEANEFIIRLMKYLGIQDGGEVLDLACGRGRHSKMLSVHNVNVLGVDLSASSIEFAKKFETETLKFEIGDMRTFSYPNRFDSIFNLFTSFGYFEQHLENVNVLRKMHQNLKEGGVLVLDYLCKEYVLANLSGKHIVKHEGTEFSISKRVENNMIVKTVEILEPEKSKFEEKVMLYDRNDMVSMMEELGFKMKAVFGNYSLDNFESKSSDRLILIAEK